MATAKTPFPIHGKIGKLIFYVRDGKQLVREKPSELKFHQGTPAMGLNRLEFGGAAKIAAEIYRNLKLASPENGSAPKFMAYAQNHLTAKIKHGGERERKNQGARFCYAREFRFHDTARALTGCDLSHDLPLSGMVQMQPLGPQHNPTSLKIIGLQEAADTIGTIGSARLEFRIQIRQTRIPELQADNEGKKWVPLQTQASAEAKRSTGQIKAHSTPSEWIPAAIIPGQGIHIPIPQWNPEAKYATCIVIEWREIHATGRRLRHLPHKAIVKIAAFHAPAEAWPKRKPAISKARKATQENQKQESDLPPLPKNPTAYLQSALQKLQL